MLIDEAVITVKGGDGGNGAATFRRNAQTAKGGPDGGNGGNGGSVYFQGVDDISLLSQFAYKKKVIAENGVNGARQKMHGRNGHDLIVFVPLGTNVTDLKTNKTFEILDTSKVLISSGGKGGRGNDEFKSATVQAPKYREFGEEGESKNLMLELKLIADIGLIGLPNAGKSSLLAKLTNANPKIGDYPFTTLEPNLGVFNKLIIADIPGLIEGASSGKGLGDKFLRHIEKTKTLIHCIDITSKDIKKDYETIRNELGQYNPLLLNKNELVVLTKTDLIKPNECKKQVEKIKKINKNTIAISIFSQNDLNVLKASILS